MNSNSACCASLLEVLCTTLALSCANRPKLQLALSPAAPDSLITCGVVEARSAGFEPSRFGLVRQQRPDSSSDLDALWLTVVRADSGASLQLHIKAAVLVPRTDGSGGYQETMAPPRLNEVAKAIEARCS